jgi:peroxiredoxin
MKTRYLLFLLSLATGAGCSPSTSSNSSSSFTNTDATYNGNVSGIYELANYGTVGSWTGVDIKWKNSQGNIQALSGYAGKPILLSFWATSPVADAAEESTLDSVEKDLGDSVGIVTVGENNNFQTFYSFATGNKITVQIVVDSVKLANTQYAAMADNKIVWPETFVLKPNGAVMIAEEGYVTEHALDSLVRVAYH